MNAALDLHALPRKLNVGCGNKLFDGYLNIDLCEFADLRCDVKDIPLPDGYAEEVLALHILEHLERWDAPLALAEWYRVLRPGGLLVLELPDLLKVCRNILSGMSDDSYTLHALFGDPVHKEPLMMHRWGWSVAEVRHELEAAGFAAIEETSPQFHAKRTRRDMRVEARKP